MVGVVVLLGAPGSGKGTQAKLIASQNPGWIHISTGDLFRTEINSGSPLGLSVKDVLTSGKLVSDDVTNQVFESQVRQILSKQAPKVLLLDGYPRTAPQAESLKRFAAASSNLGAPFVIEFKIDEKVVIARLSDRLVNPRTGKIYHRVSNPPKVLGICDEDGGVLIQRSDDQPETIRKRFKIYEEARSGIVNCLNGESALKKVNADQSTAKVSQDVLLSIQSGLGG
jgi:adenylate kinase